MRVKKQPQPIDRNLSCAGACQRPFFRIYDDILSYAESIQHYIDSGALAGVGELYYPIRLKPRGANRLNVLIQNGVNHIEIRNVDINLFAPQGIDARDLQFIEMLLLFLVSEPSARLSPKMQDVAVQNFKNAALFDIDAARITLPDGTSLSAREAGLNILKRMKAFYSESEFTAAYALGEMLSYQEEKLTVPEMRYAERAASQFKDSYLVKTP
nr:hypothetical protein [uncultured Ruminococcus sp.]